MRVADLDMDGPGDSHSDKLRSDLHIAQALEAVFVYQQFLVVVVFIEF